MQITRAVDYGLRALLVMSRQPAGQRHLLQELADRADVPRNYLVKVLKSLTSAGVVRSYRGVSGGFALNRNPGQITLRQVVEAIDGPLRLMHCLDGNAALPPCPRSGHCPAQRVFRGAQEVLGRELASHTLQELCADEAAVGPSLPSAPVP